MPADPPRSCAAGDFGCAVIGAAADGTAALLADADGMTLRVRPPGGGAFRAPLVLGDAASAPGLGAWPALAVAPGGWVVVAWLDADAGRVIAVIVRPDGTSSRKVLDRGGADVTLVEPRAGIDAHGNATVLWARFESAGTRVLTARSSAGGQFVPGHDLHGSASGRGFAVVVAPNGRSLLAWSTEAGVQASVDGQAPVVLDPDSSPWEIAASITNDGAAVIAYADYGDQVNVVDRAAGGAWSPPHSISGNRGLRLPVDDEVGLVGPSAALAFDGRAVVAWHSKTHPPRRVMAATGRAGGAWGPATRLSGLFRDTAPPTVELDAAGEPRVLWSEEDVDPRGARPVADAPIDTAPPTVDVRWPSRLPPSLHGGVRIAVRIRCSEACDVRLERTKFFYAARSLAAGQTVTVVLRTSESLAPPQGMRRIPVVLLVTDRAGNPARSSRTLRVRVVEVPLRSFKVDPDAGFAMFTTAGDRAVAGFVNALIEGLASGAIHSQGELRRRYTAGKAALARAGHDELGDTAVREALSEALYEPISRAGYDADIVID